MAAFVFHPSPAPLGGRCPVCRGVMDETGCRIVEHEWLAQPNHLGVAQVTKVECTGTPVIRMIPCPCCADRTDS